MSKNAMLMARTASCRVANAFSIKLKLIWPKSSPKTAKMSKKRVFLQKAPGVNGLNRKTSLSKGFSEHRTA